MTIFLSPMVVVNSKLPSSVVTVPLVFPSLSITTIVAYGIEFCVFASFIFPDIVILFVLCALKGGGNKRQLIEISMSNILLVFIVHLH